MKMFTIMVCLLLVFAGTVVASSYDWEDGYDDYGYGCCCAPMFVLTAVGAFALNRRQ